jgi:hypothetical protein
MIDDTKDFLLQELKALVESVPSEKNLIAEILADREFKYPDKDKDIGWNDHCDLINKWKLDNLRKE